MQLFVDMRWLTLCSQTSLNMPGFSLTLLLLPRASESGPSADKLLSLLDEPASVPGWKWTAGKAPLATPVAPVASTNLAAAEDPAQMKASDETACVEAIKRACNAVIREEAEITRMDNIAGDGDCGLTLKGGAEGTSKTAQFSVQHPNDSITNDRSCTF